ncbi:hypothetical protein K470DRAFT_209714 [Piedraia hortae CBS 480.64]|uniref:Chaperone/heat shock protein Hsp12 n=1 Tax=Piedraia hortae CBS 480.64 TaxID=1314780 RepID=A0A6A7C9X3_9PEZI|nr:hypothetical protein K470DRAFT_209714 [Piedraia hortae CBS 480.64]
MTDSTRKDLGDKIADKATPNESKSYTDQAKDSLTGAADKAQRDFVPDNQKSTGQSLQDKVSRTGSSEADKGEGLLDKAKDAMGMNK